MEQPILELPEWALSRFKFVHELRRLSRAILDIDARTPRPAIVWVSLELGFLADCLAGEWFDGRKIQVNTKSEDNE